MKNTLKPFVAAIVIALSGCASPERMTNKVQEKARSSVDYVMADRQVNVSVTTNDGIHISAIPVEYIAPPKGIVTLRGQDLPMSAALGGLVEGAGFSLSYSAGVDPQKLLAIDLRDIDPKVAIREVAMAAGYIAVFIRPDSVIIAREAAYTYRVPARLLETMNSQYSASNSSGVGGQQSSGSSTAPTSQGNTAGGGNQQANVGGGNNSQPSSAQVRISGTSQTSPDGLKAFLTTISGAQISLLPEDGIITARGTAMQLQRLSSFLEQYVRDALTQVDIELSIVEVSLTNEFQSGIDWTRIIPANGVFGSALGNISLLTGQTGGDAGMTIRSTSNSIDSVVRALEKITEVSELTRPRLIAMNHSKKLYRSSVQRPYLPSATSNTQTGGTNNVIQNSAAVAYTEDGISFSVQANVLDASHIELKLVPVYTSTLAQTAFPVGKDITLIAPIQQRQDSHLQVVAEHAKTMVLGGLRTAGGRNQATGMPGGVRIPGINLLVGGHDDRTSAREVVMLLHTRIIAPPKVVSLISESI